MKEQGIHILGLQESYLNTSSKEDIDSYLFQPASPTRIDRHKQKTEQKGKEKEKEEAAWKSGESRTEPPSKTSASSCHANPWQTNFYRAARVSEQNCNSKCTCNFAGSYTRN